MLQKLNRHPSRLLKVTRLQVEFQSEGETVQAVKGISFSLNKKEILGVVGESGSGKSVTALSVMRLLPEGVIKSGEIILLRKNGRFENIRKLSKKQLRSVRGNDTAMIFQEPMTSLNPVMRCGTQAEEALRYHRKIGKKEAKATVLALFEKVKLPNPKRIYKAYPHELSGGQKQRVMIASALSCNPSLIIADEPTTALDVTVQAAVTELLNELKNEFNVSFIFITHDLSLVSEVADRLLVMYKGAVVEEGAVKEVFQHPKHPYTKGLLACRPQLNMHAKRLPVLSDFFSVDESGQLTEKKIRTTKKQPTTLPNEEVQKNRAEIYSKEPLLVVKGLKVYFPLKKNFFGKTTRHLKAVDDVSFDVYPGETLGLVGESGCGKTTLGRSLLRLIDASEGEISYDKKNIRQLSETKLRRLRKEIQIIFQDPYSSLNPRKTIGETLAEPLRVHKLCKSSSVRSRVAELLEQVELDGSIYNRYPHEFSGGQRQRICIARALALDPRFIICDESVSALDVSVQARILNLLNRLKEDLGLTYIFISHDLSVVRYMSDRIMVMNKGKIEELGFADEVYEHPHKAYTKKLIEAIPKGLKTIKPTIG